MDWTALAKDHAEETANITVGDVAEKDRKIIHLIRSLERIAAANPRNTNSTTADQMASWTQAVASTALAETVAVTALSKAS